MIPQSTPKLSQKASRGPKMPFKTGPRFSFVFLTIFRAKTVPKIDPKITQKSTSAPRASRKPPGSHFGAILEPFWTLRGIIFQGFWPHCPLFFLFSCSPFLVRPPLLFALSLLQALRPQLGGRFWGASPCEIRPPSITKQLAVVSAAFQAVV